MIILHYTFITLELLLLFNLIIGAHELGHFLAAKWRGLKIERFAIWFGKPVWKRQINGIEYALGWIPAGGYVALPQMVTMEAIEGTSQTQAEQLPNISALDKIIVAFAGPLFSFLLALGFACVVMVVGRPVSEADTTTTIGYVETNGPAAIAGLKAGDRIVSINGEPVTKFGGYGSSVVWRIASSKRRIIDVKVDRAGKLLDFSVAPTNEPTKFWQRKSLPQLLILPAQSALIGQVIPNSPAQRAGLKVGDQIVAVDGHPVFHYAAVGDFIRSHANQDIHLQVERGGKSLAFSIHPQKPVSPANAPPLIGIIWNGTGKITMSHPGAFEQVYSSVADVVETIGALISPKTQIKVQDLGGPVMILSLYYRLFSAPYGWQLALWFSVVLNVNLALLNLLPIPVLDGGHILLAAIEGVRRKPANPRVLNFIQNTCFVLVVSFFLYITFFDVGSLFQSSQSGSSGNVVFAPQTK